MYRLHHARIHALCLSFLHNSADAEDAVQESFARLARRLPRLAGDFGRLCHDAAAGRAELETRFREDACVTVVLATEGYPAAPRTGDFIEGIDAAEELPGVTVFHAGTKQVDARVMTAGGRVLDVTAVAPTLAEARDRAYEAAGRVSWPGMQYRRDIGAAAVESQGKEPV